MLIEFSPKPTSDERLCAGVVTETAGSGIEYWCALDQRKMEHAFGATGAGLYDIAEKLCQSLADHWLRTKSPRGWTPPFTRARMGAIDRFTAQDAQEGAMRFLDRTSTLHTLLAEYTAEQQTRETGIVARVQRAVRNDANAKHLAPRFNRHLTVAGEGQPLRVDFLGQNYACYFLQITRSARGLEATTDRALGKLYALEALHRFVLKPPQTLGLLEDERPKAYELLMVGNRNDAIQRKAIYQVEALADQNEVRARIEPSAAAAAERVSDQERMAA